MDQIYFPTSPAQDIQAYLNVPLDVDNRYLKVDHLGKSLKAVSECKNIKEQVRLFKAAIQLLKKEPGEPFDNMGDKSVVILIIFRRTILTVRQNQVQYHQDKLANALHWHMSTYFEIKPSTLQLVATSIVKRKSSPRNRKISLSGSQSNSSSSSPPKGNSPRSIDQEDILNQLTLEGLHFFQNRWLEINLKIPPLNSPKLQKDEIQLIEKSGLLKTPIFAQVIQTEIERSMLGIIEGDLARDIDRHLALISLNCWDIRNFYCWDTTIQLEAEKRNEISFDAKCSRFLRLFTMLYRIWCSAESDSPLVLKKWPHYVAETGADCSFVIVCTRFLDKLNSGEFYEQAIYPLLCPLSKQTYQIPLNAVLRVLPGISLISDDPCFFMYQFTSPASVEVHIKIKAEHLEDEICPHFKLEILNTMRFNHQKHWNSEINCTVFTSKDVERLVLEPLRKVGFNVERG